VAGGHFRKAATTVRSIAAKTQYSNTVSVTGPVDNKLIGTIRLGDPWSASLSPLYKGQLFVHDMPQRKLSNSL
jgi:hypothetical protein